MNLSRKPDFFLHLIISNESTFFTRREDLLKLKQLEEAINWCDKGLAVSFLYPVHRPSFFSIEIFMCAKENKNCGAFIKPQRTG